MLSISGLSFAYPSAAPLFSDLDASVEQGEVFAIIGRNGAGKSTLLRLLNGLLRPDKGSVSIGGRDLAGLKVHQIARLVGTVFQSPEQQLFSSTASEEVAFGPRQLGFGKAEIGTKVAEAFERTGLSDSRDRHPLDLDYASRRFLMLACALASTPEVLLLDEPQRGLDRVWMERLEAILAQEKSAGRAIVMICHDMDFVDRNADSVLALGLGRPRQFRTTDFFTQDDLVSQAGVEKPWRIVVRDLWAKRQKIIRPE